ncbi:MAG: CDP-alcohol phosphatidyltransferase family protein [Desulfobacterales bacterium]|nr:CDP-alcohol phosphatidyltransferase family protein [Desulfobacterales bacterium]
MNTVESSRRQRLPKLTINIPNILTVLRILVTPLFVIFLIRNQHGYALLVFVFAGVSDGLDGLIARWLNQRSDLGAVLDPIADKLLLTAAYITLGILKDIPGWLAVLVISRDVLIVTGIAVLTFADIHFDIRPSLVSKWTTVFQILLIGVSLLEFDFSGAQTLQAVLGWVTAGMTVLSGLHYTYLGLNILQTGYGAQAKKDAD